MSLIENLVSLHRVDSQVRALRGRLDSAKTYLKSQERQHSDACARRDELRSQIRQMQATAVNIENESNAIRDRIEALRGELNKSTNQKAYATILSELKLLQEKRALLRQDRNLSRKRLSRESLRSKSIVWEEDEDGTT